MLLLLLLPLPLPLPLYLATVLQTFGIKADMLGLLPGEGTPLCFKHLASESGRICQGKATARLPACCVLMWWQ
jgi:hypothetical protein